MDHCAIDVGEKKSQVCVRDSSGTIQFEGALETSQGTPRDGEIQSLSKEMWMATSITWYPDLPAFLPKDEPLARLVARLFVLWNDLLFEQVGIVDDDGSPPWLRTTAKSSQGHCAKVIA
jgi:hypothetical protein